MAGLKQAGEDKRRSKQAIFPAPLGEGGRRFSGLQCLAPVVKQQTMGGGEGGTRAKTRLS